MVEQGGHKQPEKSPAPEQQSSYDGKYSSSMHNQVFDDQLKEYQAKVQQATEKLKTTNQVEGAKIQATSGEINTAFALETAIIHHDEASVRAIRKDYEHQPQELEKIGKLAQQTFHTAGAKDVLIVSVSDGPGHAFALEYGITKSKNISIFSNPAKNHVDVVADNKRSEVVEIRPGVGRDSSDSAKSVYGKEADKLIKRIGDDIIDEIVPPHPEKK